MKRYKKNYLSGFTLAELMISLLVTSLLAAALVPMVGVKKIKYPKKLFNHGIAECYYVPDGNDWKLHYYYESSGKNPTIIDRDIEDGEYCTFTAPNAPYVEIIGIGAGGSNNYGDKVLSANVAHHSIGAAYGTSHTDNIHVDERFLFDIAAADNALTGLSAKLRKALNEWSKLRPSDVVGVYYVKSPLGKSGETVCAPQFIVPTNRPWYEDCFDYCHDENNNPKFDNDACKGPQGNFLSVPTIIDAGVCWAYIHGRGQSSGAGISSGQIQIPLTGDSQINITEDTSKAGIEVIENPLGVSDKNKITRSFYLTSSGSGAAPGWMSGGYSTGMLSEPESAKCISENLGNICSSMSPESNYVNYSPTLGIVKQLGYGCTPYASPAREGSVQAAEEGIAYEYNSAILDTIFPRAGKPGETKSKIYENLIGTFNLKPARSVGSRTIVSQENDEERVLLTVNSGANGTMDNNFGHYHILTADLPVVKETKDLATANNREHFVEYLSKLNSSRYHGGIGVCPDSECPGFAGSGSYPYITSIDAVYKLTLTNTMLPNKPSYTLSGEKVDGNDAVKCDTSEFSSEPIALSSGGAKYCRPNRTKGNPGAVIVIW